MRLWPFTRDRRRARKYRLIRLATRLENFLLSIWSKKLLVVTSTLLLVTGYYAKNLFVEIPAELLESSNEHELRANEVMYEVNTWMTIGNNIAAAATSFQDTFSYLNGMSDVIKLVSTVDGKSSYLIDTKTIETFLGKVRESRSKIIVVVAGLKASSFRQPELVDFYKGFEDDFREINQMLGNLEDMYTWVLTGKWSELADTVKRLHPLQERFQETVLVLEQRSTDMLERMKNLKKSLEIKQSKQEFGELALAVRTLTMLGLMGVTAFSAILTWKLRKEKPALFPLTKRQCDISRSQRQKYRAIRQARKVMLSPPNRTD